MILYSIVFTYHVRKFRVAEIPFSYELIVHETGSQCGEHIKLFRSILLQNITVVTDDKLITFSIFFVT